MFDMLSLSGIPASTTAREIAVARSLLTLLEDALTSCDDVHEAADLAQQLAEQLRRIEHHRS